MAADHLYKISWQQFRENITENFRFAFIQSKSVFAFPHALFRDLREANQLHDVSLYIDSHHSIGAHKVF